MVLRSLALLVLLSSTAFAHTHLVRSDPADSASLSTSPPTLTLVFAEPVTLTAVKIESDAAKLNVVPLPPAPTAEAKLPLPTLAAGRYTVRWRAASDDGHVMSGTIHFSVGPSGS
jgi:copper resistance protein C